MTATNSGAQLSVRAQQLQPSPTLAISALAKSLKAAGEKVLSLAAGEPDFPTPVHIRQAAVAAMEAGHTGYAPSAGIPALRDAIRQRYQAEFGLTYQDPQVVVSCGAKQCLYNAFMAILDPGTEAIIQAPYWVSYPEQVRLCGAEPVLVEAPAPGAALNLAAIGRAINDRTRLIVLNSPSNPTGQVCTAAELDQLAELAIKHDLVVVSDDIYDKLIFDGRQFENVVSRRAEMMDRTVVINGVSKTYAMTGWRLGYAVGPQPIIAAMRKIQDQSTSNAVTFVQHAAIAALQSEPAVVADMVATYDRRRHRLVELLSALNGVSCELPAGSFYAFADFSPVLARKHNGQAIGTSLKLAEILLDQERVAVIPGSAFGAEGYLRISFATSTAVIEEATERIASLIQGLD